MGNGSSQELPPNQSLQRHEMRRRGDIRPGTHRMQRLLGHRAESSFWDTASILLTGTNGKGSVAALVDRFLRAHGLRTGLYTSPHLVDFEERIRIDGKPVTEVVLAPHLDELEREARTSLPDATFFELATGAALLSFCQARVDVQVMEIGLGGRFDSTNVVSPIVSALTSVGRDHQAELGDDIRGIAFDKSFVSRRRRPFVVGSLCCEAEAGMREAVDITGADVVYAHETLSADLEHLCLTAGEHSNPWIKINVQHVRTALHVVDAFLRETGRPVSVAALEVGLNTVLWPGRFDQRVVAGSRWLFDACHNPSGLDYFLDQLRRSSLSGERFVVVFAAFADKDWRRMLPLLPSVADHLILTQTESERAQSAHSMVGGVPGDLSVEVCTTLSAALVAARSVAGKRPILLLGSILLIGDAMKNLGIRPFERRPEDCWGGLL